MRVDAALRGAAVRFCGGAAPIAAAAELRVSGPVAVARQATAPPETYGRDVTVGRLRSARVSLPAKHARPLVKAFTDLRITAADVASTYGVGLEPTIALVRKPYPRKNYPGHAHRVTAAEMTSTYGVGLEPTIALVRSPSALYITRPVHGGLRTHRTPR